MILAGSLLSLTNLGYSQAASNGSPNGFTISPVITEVTINKGQTYTVPITIENPTSVATNAIPIVNDFVASSNETGEPSIIINNNASLPTNNFIPLVDKIPDIPLGPNAQTTIDVNISVPANANPGGYYGAIRFAPTQQSGQQSNVGLTASVGTLFLITVPGNLIQKLTLVQLSAANSSGTTGGYFTGGKISLVTRLQNVGNIHVQPFGTLQVKNMFGKVVATVQVNNQQPRGNVLPNSIRRFTNSLPNNIRLLGHYTIVASIGYGTGGGNLIVAQAGFWYLPIWLLIILAILVVIIVALIYWASLKMRKRRFSKKL